MFGFLFGKKKQQVAIGNSLVWMTTALKWKMIGDEVKKAASISLFYYDEKTKQELIKQLERIGETELTKIHFYNMNFPERVRFASNQTPCFFIEHALSFAQEQKALRHLKEVCGIEKIDFYVSLDDELFIKYIGTSLKDLMGKLGANENESIQHTMINQSIIRCQQKYDKDR